METGLVQDVDYDFIYFSPFSPYGYGVNSSQKRLDFFDENLNILISNFPYFKFHLPIEPREFSYQIINDYVLIKKYYALEFNQGKHRVILYKKDNTTILDSFHHRLYPLGDFIQIVHDGKSEFLNTVTGEIKPLSLSVPLTNMKNGMIDTEKIKQPRLLFSDCSSMPFLPDLKNDEKEKENSKQKSSRGN